MHTARHDKPYIIAITGGRCAGKSLLSNTLKSKLGHNVSILDLDDYHHDWALLSGTTTLKKSDYNFEQPLAYDFDKLITDLTHLRRGQIIKASKYNQTTKFIVDSDRFISPSSFIIVKGTLLLISLQLRRMFNHSLYLECQESTRFERYARRNMQQIGIEEKLSQVLFSQQIAPVHLEHIAPSKVFADRVVSQTEFQQAYGGLIEKIVNDIDVTTGRAGYE